MERGDESWIDRYRAGDRDRVWDELRLAGGRVREPDVIDDARAVCDEMAMRARQNIEVIVERLRSQGFVFHTNDDEQRPVIPHVPPGSQADDLLGWMDRRLGYVPMTVVSWLRHVGDVWLVGTHPDWPSSSAADPLVIELEGSRHPGELIVEYFDEELSNAEDEAEGAEVRFELPVAPDRLHKANISGGGPYGFVVPDACADGLFIAEVELPFVSYLRWVFSRGGFPVQTGATEGEWRVRNQLAVDLLPL